MAANNIKVDFIIFQYDKFTHKKLEWEGEFGKTFVAKYPGFDRVSLMEVSHSLHGNKKRLEKEANNMFQLNSKYIVNILGVVLEPRNTCLVMEYMKYFSLKRYMEKYKYSYFDWPLRIRILYQTALGLNYLHKKRIIHQGLEPSVVMLDEHLNVKLGESGFRQQTLMATWSQSASSYQQTLAQNAFTSTVFYHPPEHIKDINLKATVSTDMYAYGILVWQITMCSEPYKDITSDNQEILKLVGEHKLRPNPIPPNPDIPDIIERLIVQCLPLDPIQRLSTTDVIKELEPYHKSFQKQAEKIAFEVTQQSEISSSFSEHPQPALKSNRLTEKKLPVHHPEGEHSTELDPIASETQTKGVAHDTPQHTLSATAFSADDNLGGNVASGGSISSASTLTGFSFETQRSTDTSNEVMLHENNSLPQADVIPAIPAEGSPLPIQPRHLFDIATHLGKKWRRFGHLILHFSEGELDNFEYGQSDLKDVSFKMLSNWVDTNGGKQVITLGALVAKLKEGKLFDVARRIRLDS